MSTPGADDPVDNGEHVDEALDSESVSTFRGLAARMNYLASDRPTSCSQIRNCVEK